MSRRSTKSSPSTHVERLSMKPREWVFCRGAVSLLAALWLAMVPARAGESVLHLDRADFVLSDAALPPSADAPWSPQALPDLWALSRPGIVQTSGWTDCALRFPRALTSLMPSTSHARGRRT